MGKKSDKAEKEKELRKEAFDAYYQGIYASRWPALKAALQKESKPIAYSQGLVKPYFLDQASVLVASLLPVKSGDRILDMCAAPGGKSLVIASKLQGKGSLTANDRSPERKHRLDKVLDEHLSSEIRQTIITTNRDASIWGTREKDAYDLVLLDAPCSSERHVIQDDKHLSIWSVSRPKRLAIEQFALLCSALDCVKVGGYILYSTCAINPQEDEGVIEKLFERRIGRVKEIPITLSGAECKTHGLIILPDLNDGQGPLYCCLVQRIS